MNSTLIFSMRLTPLTPIQHGGEGDGSNIVPIARQPIATLGPDGAWEQSLVPYISGGSLKGILRQIATRTQLIRLGYAEGTVSKAALRLLAKGGLLSGSTGQSVGLAAMREFARVFPVIDAFGAMDNALTVPGAVSLTDAMPYTTATAALPWMQSTWGADGVGAQPIPIEMVVTERTNYRHDVGASQIGAFIAPAERAAIADAADKKKSKKADGAIIPAEERRATTDAMPHTAEVIVTGTPMACQVTIRNATESARMCVLVAISEWVAGGALVGGGTGKGFGRCKVEIVDARLIDGAAATPVTIDGASLPIPTRSADDEIRVAFDRFMAHLDANADRARELLGAVS